MYTADLHKSFDMLSKNTKGAKKARPKLEVPVSSYSCIRLKSLISGGGQGPTELFASNNVRSITYKFQKVQSLTVDVQQFERNHLVTWPSFWKQLRNMDQRWPSDKLIMLKLLHI